MNYETLSLADSDTRIVGRPEAQEGVPNTREVLEELFQLLEEYAPTWYTEEHHNRAVAALLGRNV